MNGRMDGRTMWSMAWHGMMDTHPRDRARGHNANQTTFAAPSVCSVSCCFFSLSLLLYFFQKIASRPRRRVRSLVHAGFLI